MPAVTSSRLIAVVLVLAGFAAACGADNGSPGTPSDPAAAADAALDERAAQPASGPASAATDDSINPDTDSIDPTSDIELSGDEPHDPATVPGGVINQYVLEIDQCFDRIEDLVSGRTTITTTLLPCDTVHHFQIFGRLQYPAPHPSLYPGDDIMEDFALDSCYLRFEDWVGAAYETSALDIGVLTPDRTNFEDELARYRGIHCWVRRVDGEPLAGTARGSQL